MFGQRRHDKTPYLPQQVRYRHGNGGRQRHLHVQIELAGQRRVDHIELHLIDANPVIAENGVREVAQPPVRREIRRLGPHQDGIDDEFLTDESGDHHDDQRHHAPHQMGTQRLDMFKKSHLVVG